MKKKIVVSGIFYPFTLMSYLLRALQRREDVELFTMGPFTGTFIPWNGGMNLPMDKVYTPDYPLPSQLISGMRFPVKLVEKLIPWIPDLWLQIDAGFHFEGHPDCANVIVGTDPHVFTNGHYDDARLYADKFFGMQTSYMKGNDIYLPFAYDPTLHYPEIVDVVYDVAMPGVMYDNRKQAFDLFVSHGYKVNAVVGSVFDDYRREIRSAKVGFNWSSLDDLTARVWEFAGCNVPMVVNRVTDLCTFFEDGQSCMVFSTLQEACEKVKFLLENPSKASWLAKNAHDVVEKDHTWDKRIEFILEQVGLND